MPTYGISAKYQDIKKINLEVEEYSKANDSAKKLTEKRDELTNSYNSFTDAQRNRLVTFLPDNIDPIRFILEMEGIGKKFGMPIKNAKYTAVKNINNPEQNISDSDLKYAEFTFEFATEGSYDNFVKLLNEFDKSLRLIDVVAISIASGSLNSSQEGENSPVDFYKYNVTVKAYWLK